MNAGLKKVIKKGSKRRVKFQYDPLSCGLNSDDDCSDFKDRNSCIKQEKILRASIKVLHVLLLDLVCLL